MVDPIPQKKAEPDSKQGPKQAAPSEAATPSAESPLADLTGPDRIAATCDEHSTSVGPEKGEEPVLQVPELRAVTSLDDLRARYAEKGAHFTVDQDLFSRVEQDWKRGLACMLEDHWGTPLPESHPLLSLEVDGRTHNIYGCMHTFSIGPRCYELLIKAITEKPWWVNEQNLGTEFLPGMRSLEIDDRNARGVPYRIIDETVHMLKIPLDIPRQLQKKIWMSKHQKEQGNPHILYETALHLPFDGPLPMPAHIDLMKREALGLGYTTSQLRSLYMASFFRTWDPEAANRPSAEIKAKCHFSKSAWEEKNILVGGAHAHEIEYFLKHQPIWGERVSARARSDAELYNRDPHAMVRRWQIRNSVARLGSFAAALGAGYGLAQALGLFL